MHSTKRLNAALAFIPITPGASHWQSSPDPHLGPHNGAAGSPKAGIMACTKDNDSESCYGLFSKRNSFLLEN